MTTTNLGIQLNFDSARPLVVEWARNFPEIHAVVLFGSQALGTQGPQSDLDLCVVVDPWGGETWYARWIFQADGWKSALTKILAIPSDKLQFCSLTSPQVRSGLEKGCKFLYLREYDLDSDVHHAANGT